MNQVPVEKEMVTVPQPTPVQYLSLSNGHTENTLIPDGMGKLIVFIYRHKSLSSSYCRARLRTCGRRSGLHITPHQLRFSFATLLLNAGTPILTVQRFLGHQFVETTLRYARLYDGTVVNDYRRTAVEGMNRPRQLSVLSG